MPSCELPQGHGMYSPLSQNMTDSDSSEEEIHSRQTKSAKMSMASSHLADMHEIDYSNYCNIDDRFGHQNMESDNVAILNASKTEMGPIRKCLFVLSIILCVLTIVLFLWVVPCTDDAMSCPAMIDRVKTHNWLRSYENIEFKGSIYVVNGLRGRSKNLVAMYRKDKRIGDNETGPRKSNGVISLLGNNGGVSWYNEIMNEPIAIDCSLIDADLNGTPDCLIVDEFGEIGCINPLSGNWIWHIADRTDGNRNELLSFPLVLPDLNSDKVNELQVASTVNTLIILSGKNGLKIGSRYAMKECSFIHKFQLDVNYKVSFICIKNETELQIVKPLVELYQLIANRSIELHPKQQAPISQHKFYGQRKNTVSQRNIYSVSGKQLIVENNGRCPENCNVSVELIELKNGRNQVLRNFNGSRMYGMVPPILSFNASATDSKSGFVIKFWEWAAQESDVTFHSKPKRSTASNEFNLFANFIKQKKPWRKPQTADDVKFRYERSIDIQNASKESILKSRMRLIKETVILIVFNSTDTKIENTSQSNIIQFCQGEQTDIECQPDLNFQENSLLIADLDQDASQELVSFYSTYVNRGNDTSVASNWQLVTYLQLLRLEAELPKLYSTPTPDQN